MKMVVSGGLAGKVGETLELNSDEVFGQGRAVIGQYYLRSGCNRVADRIRKCQPAVQLPLQTCCRGRSDTPEGKSSQPGRPLKGTAGSDAVYPLDPLQP